MPRDTKCKKQERLGEIRKNNFGTEMKIIGYKNALVLEVEFQDKYKFKTFTRYEHFKNGLVKNPYDKEVCEIGYIGVGKYNYKEYPKIYNTWRGMLQRCYDPYFINKHLSYIDCYVCDEWHNFQNFAKWYEENIYNCNNERMELDKDILYKGNKVYSPETCLIVPGRINVLFVKQEKHRGRYPIGVCYHKQRNKLYVSCNVFENNKSKRDKFLGYFPLNRPFQAFYTYKTFKENYIKQVADEYKDLIPEKLYNALYRYEVEIND